MQVNTDLAVIVADMGATLVKDRRGRAWLSAGGGEPVLLTLADAQGLTFWLAQWIREQPDPEPAEPLGGPVPGVDGSHPPERDDDYTAEAVNRATGG